MTTPGSGPIVLYCDLAVDPNREQEMLHHFHHDFKPAAEKFDGFIDLKMLRLRKVFMGDRRRLRRSTIAFNLPIKAKRSVRYGLRPKYMAKCGRSLKTR